MPGKKELPENHLDAPPTVGREDAIAIIEAVMCTRESRKFQRPDPGQLASDISKIQQDYLFRKTIDSMLPLSELDDRYAALRHAANALQNALDNVTGQWSAHYFLADAQHGRSERRFEVEELAGAMINRLVRRTTNAERAVKIARGSDNRQKWYELTEGHANDWLWEIAIPELFFRSFNWKYAINGSKRNPGVRFVEALFPKAGFPSRAPGTLKGRFRKHKEKGGDNQGE